MRTLLIIAAILAVAALPVADASAQVTVTGYFDQNFTVGAKDCPGAGVLDSLYVVGAGFGTFVSGASYQISYPSSMLFLADLPASTSTMLGSSPTGIAIGFALPQNGFFAVVLEIVLFQWMCNDCSSGEEQIVISGNPLLNPAAPEWTDWPSNDLFTGIGMTSLVCATVSTEETTWGKVKALYTN